MSSLIPSATSVASAAVIRHLAELLDLPVDVLEGDRRRLQQRRDPEAVERRAKIARLRRVHDEIGS